MAVAKNRSELVDVAHPGFKVVYEQTADKDGKKVVIPHTLPEIDANEAVTRFPDVYSYTQPEDAGPVVPSPTADPYAPPPPAPAVTSPAAPVGPITDGVVQEPAAVTDGAADSLTSKVAASNDKAVDQAKASDKPTK